MAMGGRTGETFTDINVTPLTDVFLVLLVIMILVAPLVNQTVLKVDPPQAPSNQPQQKPPEDKRPKIRIDVSAQGVVTVNGSPVQPADSFTIQQRIASEQAKAASPDILLELQSDADAQQRYVVAVMDAAAGAGIKSMRVLPLKASK
ncbi:MAG: biopolymer transporter ExbD [Candidatus Obscuribacterales bacterium]|nr:biopolymer transporter ExbD [Candidatus Obscuribacterales bacterium]